jgi:serpin B
MMAADTAALAVNEVGLDLYRKLAGDEASLCLSPYSIQSALVMAFAGADGETRAEMAKVLHFSGNDDTIHDAFASLRDALELAVTRSVERAKESEKRGGPSEPIRLQIANRLFGQKGQPFRTSFLDLLKNRYGAPLEQVDFARDSSGAARQINSWVEDQTRRRIRDLIPPDALDAQTRLVLANAIYLKAPWATEFSPAMTKPEPFHVRGREKSDVPMMIRHDKLGYLKGEGFTAVTLAYSGGDLHFLILVPDEVDGLRELEARLTAARLAECANLGQRDVILHLPKFKLEPPTLPLGTELQALGMRSAFDDPPSSANFDRIAPRRAGDYLYISDVFHKTFIAVDEHGTEAAAATAVAMATRAAPGKPLEPVEVKVDRPFVFAIQHGPSAACLFLGRVTEPAFRADSR